MLLIFSYFLTSSLSYGKRKHIRCTSISVSKCRNSSSSYCLSILIILASSRLCLTYSLTYFSYPLSSSSIINVLKILSFRSITSSRIRIDFTKLLVMPSSFIKSSLLYISERQSPTIWRRVRCWFLRHSSIICGEFLSWMKVSNSGCICLWSIMLKSVRQIVACHLDSFSNCKSDLPEILAIVHPKSIDILREFSLGIDKILTIIA